MCAKKTGSIEDLAVVGIDIGKDTFHLAEIAVTGPMVRAILAAIRRLRAPPLCA